MVPVQMMNAVQDMVGVVPPENTVDISARRNMDDVI